MKAMIVKTQIFSIVVLGAALTVAGCKKEEPPAPTPEPVAKPEPAPKVEEKAPPKEEAKPANKTLENAMVAFNGESNASKRYGMFAAKADEEGYKGVAKLFRAASKAESVHAAALGEIITKMGETPTPTMVEPEVKTTEENLKASLAGETEEFTKMYPGFIETATAENNLDAVKIFNGAKAAEESHAKFYKEASENLKAWKKDNKTFFVCGVCGYTVTEVNFEACPICSAPKDKYAKVE
jgi:rubrerythrin